MSTRPLTPLQHISIPTPTPTRSLNLQATTSPSPAPPAAPPAPAPADLEPSESESPDGGIPITEPPKGPDIITLQVCGQRFLALRDTLTDESHYFQLLLSGRYGGDKQADGSYFIDTDPPIFAHVLRYLRTQVLLVFYTSANGHDFGMYDALLMQAQYFQIDRLERWIKEKKYLKAVTVRREVTVFEEGQGFVTSVQADEVREYHPVSRFRRKYRCPTNTAVHTEPSRCGKRCLNVRGDGPEKWEYEEFLCVVEIGKEVVIDRESCFES